MRMVCVDENKRMKRDCKWFDEFIIFHQRKDDKIHGRYMADGYLLEK